MESDSYQFKDWQETLVSLVNELVDNGKSVKLIALSRKMPRLISWMRESFPEEVIKPLTDVLDDPRVELTTEHSLPFILSDYDPDEDEIIVLDDIVVYGETLLSVVNEIRYLTGKTPLCHPIFELQRTMGDLQLPTINGFKPQQLESLDKVKSVINDLSKTIASSGLPIDMEFPILHLPDFRFCSIREQLLDTFKDARSYDLSCDVVGPLNVGRSFTVLLEDEINRAFNNDFAKIRLFDVDGDSRLVCYAPNMLSEGQLTSEDLFENPVYASFWAKILATSRPYTESFAGDTKPDISVIERENMHSALEHRWLKSLTVAANYMFSLSMMMRNLKKFMPDVLSEAIDLSDLELIFGRNLARTASMIIEEIIEGKTESLSRRRMLEVKAEIVPEKIAGQFDALKILETVKAPSDELKIMSLFRLSYSLKNSLSKTLPPSLRAMKHNAIYESFESLYNLPFKSLQSREGENTINKTVDRLIDRGGLIPVYLPVKAKNGLTYWRRFFRASHIIGKLEKEAL